MAEIKYTYKNRIYRFDGYLLMKLPDGSWCPAVLYSDTESGMFFCREQKDFEYKFKPLTSTNDDK